MGFKSDIEIAQETELKDIREIGKKLGLSESDLELYGKYKAKINYNILKNPIDKVPSKLILVTAISPTPEKEGKTTTVIGLADALSRLGKKAAAAIREPSIGEIFGVRGGAAGGGYAQVVPMEDINLHFTGDFHAVEAANNLLAAIIDNHIYQGNYLNIDNKKIIWKRVMNMSDRQLRNIVCGIGGNINGVPREDSFDITAASEVMAILCLANDIMDLKEKLGNMIIGFSRENRPITARDLNINGAMAAILKDALKPNLVQTLEGTPVLIHGSSLTNIAHGCNSVIATKIAMRSADYTVTEAGFGADLGAEKFIDIECRKAGLRPDAAVIVASIKALKYNGGFSGYKLGGENLAALERGMENLLKHVENVTEVYGLPAVVAINRFPNDTERELSFVRAKCKESGVNAVLSEVWEKGGEGGMELAEEVLRIIGEEDNNFQYVYDINLSIRDKIKAIAEKVYGADDVDYTANALKEIKRIEEIGYGRSPICMAKTQYSLSDNPLKLGRPKGFKINVREVRVSAGAGFIVAFAGEIVTMPGLPKIPSAENIDVDENGRISGLF